MQITNPYLPSWEYVPDGEPHVFGDRVYLYGSHDRFNGSFYCQNDYVCWSAPVEDLTNWRYEGIIFRKTQIPGNEDGSRIMQAPDVARGADGRYYLYINIAMGVEVHIAVCDSPAGPYQYLDCVRWPGGKPFGQRHTDPTPFDPAVFVDEDGRVFLYVGNSFEHPVLNRLGRLIGMKKIQALGGWVVELQRDMRTVKGKVKPTVPGPQRCKGTEFESAPFFEASSMRKYDGKYYFIYSSVHSHDLSYAVSEYPDRDFHYGGTLLSNGNVGIGDSPEASFFWGNNHGSLLRIGTAYYVFGHRQTNRHEFSRQAIAEPIRFADGRFEQAEYTSRGLNGAPLKGKGRYSASIACYLTAVDGACKVSELGERDDVPYLTQSGEDREEAPDQYVANLRMGATVGFKDFMLQGKTLVSVRAKADGEGNLLVKTEPKGSPVAQIAVAKAEQVVDLSADRPILANGIHGLYFTYEGSGAVALHSFALEEAE